MKCRSVSADSRRNDSEFLLSGRAETSRRYYCLGMAQPSPTKRVVELFIDESKFSDPKLLLAGAVVFEDDLTLTETRVESEYRRLSGSYYLDDMKSFQEFRKNGFHATSDIMEISNAFVKIISEILGAKIFIECSDHSKMPERTTEQTFGLLETRLAELVLRKYRWAGEVRFTFEQHEVLNKHYGRIVEYAVERARFEGEVRVNVGIKKDPHVLSIVDYAMHCYARARRSEPAEFEQRSWKAVRPLVSSVRNLDRGRVEVRRGLVSE